MIYKPVMIISYTSKGIDEYEAVQSTFKGFNFSGYRFKPIEHKIKLV